MKAHILHIGVLDKQGQVHAVTFSEGVNVITGRSSTGKSALIEIFDFCFGSSDFTVPVGVITECADLYFTVMKVNESAIVLARRAGANAVFLKEVLELEAVAKAELLTASFFDDEYFSPLRDFLKALKYYFGVNVTDVDEDLAQREWKKRKSSTPSARGFTSFMLQHQNLVANKHAIFYRFDQKEKREQTVDHLKIFLGFANQKYFMMAQELNKLEREQRQLERILPQQKEAANTIKGKLEIELRLYEAISGTRLEINIENIVTTAKQILSKIRKEKVKVLTASDKHVKLFQDAEDKRRKIVARLRGKQLELAAVKSSIEFSYRYTEKQNATVLPESTELHTLPCPFCNSESSEVENQANDLSEAINWLNSELSRSTYRLASFEEEKGRVVKDINGIKLELENSNLEINKIAKQILDLKKVRSQYEQAVEAKIRVESVLNELVELKEKKTDEEMQKIKDRIKELKLDLKNEFDIDRKMRNAELRIQKILEELGGRFEFEDSYTPIKLRFSLDTFDLWHEPSCDKKIFLRSMGSGANWLSCHLVLFLALHRYFCELGNECAIPSVLFFDQPSQVYFPSVLDGASEFSAEELAKKDFSRKKSRKVDEDVRAVSNLFSQLVTYCKETKDATGIMPQIIVADHADHLELDCDVSFETLVKERWRGDGEGFIDVRDEM